MAWIKIGQLQKGKIFSVYGGETFDLHWYSDNVSWNNPIVISQVSSAFFTKNCVTGFKTQITKYSNTVYKVDILELGKAVNHTDVANWFNGVIAKNYSVDGGRIMNVNETQNLGTINNVLGLTVGTYTPDTTNPSGYFDIMLDNQYLVFRGNLLTGNSLQVSFRNLPCVSGSFSTKFTNSNTTRLCYVVKVEDGSWTTTSGIATVYANESFGVNY